MNSCRSGPEGGLTLVEILVAMAILAVGLMATALAFQYALSGIENGRGETMATFLVEAKIEELKSAALVDWTHNALTAGTTTEYCQADGRCSPTAASLTYRRDTTVTDSPGGTCTGRCKLVRVAVHYRPLSSAGQLDQERRVDVLTMFVART